MYDDTAWDLAINKLHKWINRKPDPMFIHPKEFRDLQKRGLVDADGNTTELYDKALLAQWKRQAEEGSNDD
jgi:hypothetical protein